MRTLALRARCAVGAARFWELRSDPGWDAYQAACDGHTFVLERSEERSTRMRRVTRLLQAWPRPLLTVLGLRAASELYVRVEMEWDAAAHGPDTPCTLVVTVPAIGDRFRVSGRLWVEARGDACELCTHYTIDVRAPWPFGAQIEAAVARAMLASYAAQPRHAEAYVRATRVRCVAARTPGSICVPREGVQIITPPAAQRACASA